MSTRSRIGVIRTQHHPMDEERYGHPAEWNVQVESIYCHFDGYPEGVGAILDEHYADPAKLDALLALGDLSQLGAELGEPHNFDTALDDTRSGAIPETWTLAYRRDRGEDNVESVTHPYGDWPDYGQEFDYLLTATGWVYRASAYGKPSGDPWHILEREKVAS